MLGRSTRSNFLCTNAAVTGTTVLVPSQLGHTLVTGGAGLWDHAVGGMDARRRPPATDRGRARRFDTKVLLGA